MRNEEQRILNQLKKKNLQREEFDETLEQEKMESEQEENKFLDLKDFGSGDPKKRLFREESYENILKTPQHLSSNEKQKETLAHKNLETLPVGVFDTFEACISAKGEMKPYKNEKGEGKSFSVTIEDYDKRTIRAVFFNDSADHFFPLVEKGGLYQMKKGRVKYVDADYNKG